MSEVERAIGINDELTVVLDDTSCTPKHSEPSTFPLMLKDCRIAICQLLIAPLSFSGIVKSSIFVPSVEVAMLLPRRRVGEES